MKEKDYRMLLKNRIRFLNPKPILESTSGVYAIYCLVTGVCYVGSSKMLYDRFSIHKTSLQNNCNDNKRLQEDYNKYGDSNFRFAVLEYVYDLAMLRVREQYWINTFSQLESLYNECLDSQSSLGYRHSKLTKERMSLAHKGKSNGRLGKPAWNKGIPRSNEVKQKISVTKKGKALSNEEKQRISRDMKYYWQKKKSIVSY
jgi:group I intron endonuclease